MLGSHFIQDGTESLSLKREGKKAKLRGFLGHWAPKPSLLHHANLPSQEKVSLPIIQLREEDYGRENMDR
jgi:hypothetical protein